MAKLDICNAHKDVFVSYAGYSGIVSCPLCDAEQKLIELQQKIDGLLDEITVAILAAINSI